VDTGGRVDRFRKKYAPRLSPHRCTCTRTGRSGAPFRFQGDVLIFRRENRRMSPILLPGGGLMNARALLLAATAQRRSRPAAARRTRSPASPTSSRCRWRRRSSSAQDAPQILQEYGRYEDEALQAYVNELGQRIAAKSHRPDLQYTFTVLDSEEVNAFALPGYVYITRGIMAYLNSEAELAAVLGHEVGHIRHATRCASRLARPPPASARP